MTTIEIKAKDGDLSAYIAAPEGAGPWPGVCVIHNALGMSQDLRNQADWLASEGYLAAVPDLFDGGTFLGCLRTIMRDFGRGEGLRRVVGWVRRWGASVGARGVWGSDPFTRPPNAWRRTNRLSTTCYCDGNAF